MIIELFGLPASGKSSLAKSLKEEGYFAVSIKSRSSIIFFNLLFIIFHPVSFFGLLFFLIKGANTLSIFRFNLTQCFLYRNAKCQRALFSKEDKVLIDEGLIQNILSFFSRELSREEVRNILKLSKKVDEAYILRTEESIRQIRLKNKQESNRVLFGEEYFDSWKNSMVYNYNLVLEVLSEEKIFPYKFIDSK